MELNLTVPCVLFALHREAAPFLRALRFDDSLQVPVGQAALCDRQGSPLVVAETGVGTETTEAVLDWLTDRAPLRPRLILSAGFAGSLQEAYRVGDVVVATEVLDTNGHRWPTTVPGEENGDGLRRGVILTVPSLVTDSAEKRRLGHQYTAAVADMESAAVARWCHRRGVPFGCVRAVSDDVDTALSPRLTALLSGGRVAPLGVLMALARSPAIAAELWRLARHTSGAAGQLAAALDKLLAGTAHRAAGIMKGS